MAYRNQASLRNQVNKAQAYGEVGDDMNVARLARGGTKIRPMEKLMVFDSRFVTINAAGQIAGPVMFFGNARSSHPGGQWATNMERDASLPNNKEWLIKDIGFSIIANPTDVVAATPAEVMTFIEQLQQLYAGAHVITTDNGNRELDRGLLCHYPSGNQIQQRTPFYDNPAAVAAYRAQGEPINNGLAQKRTSLRIDWFAPKGSSFGVKLDFGALGFPLVFAQAGIGFLADMTVTQFAEIG
ncbi:MAG: hypothetical protein WC477_07395 [Patescibacteria group bacterium]